jgi:hypothetical protein
MRKSNPRPTLREIIARMGRDGMHNKLEEEESSGWRSRAIIFRCPDDVYDHIVSWIESMPDCYVVYTRSSSLKLFIKEGGW